MKAAAAYNNNCLGFNCAVNFRCQGNYSEVLDSFKSRHREIAALVADFGILEKFQEAKKWMLLITTTNIIALEEETPRFFSI